MSCGEHQYRRRDEMHQADHAELERAAGQLVDLPADRHSRDLVGIFREAARAQVKHEGAVAEQVFGRR
jgi:hypothetical protein